MAINRKGHLSVRVTDEEREMLHAIAEVKGESASTILRQYIRTLHAELFGRDGAKKRAAKSAKR